mmetsp:Transcript_110536/g.226144  ORF Transcript_110536/g.226144 Transcript_110536/m.226144 type:complete len:305 (-) Transcript_110536:305-1219(-)
MVADPCLSFLAVVARRSGEEGRLSSLASSSASETPVQKEGKGIIHVWDLREALAATTATKETSTGTVQSIPASANTTTKIVAYPNHVVRGLEYLRLGTNDSCLVSASLQGEVKFWKERRPGNSDRDGGWERERERNGGAEGSGIPRASSGYVCVYRFQSPGKIFSLASWSSSSLLPRSFVASTREACTGRILLAAGEARGQVRVWRVSPESLSSCSSSSIAEEREVLLDPSSPRHRRKTGHNGGGASSYNDNSKQQRLEECLSTEVGDHVHYDNIKLLHFTPDGRSLAVSRAFDSKIWFQTIWQ